MNNIIEIEMSIPIKCHVHVFQQISVTNKNRNKNDMNHWRKPQTHGYITKPAMRQCDDNMIDLTQSDSDNDIKM